MISTATTTKALVGVSLEIKVRGLTKFITTFDSVTEAADYAVKLITSGEAIPKAIRMDDETIMNEADINIYWEESCGISNLKE